MTRSQILDAAEAIFPTRGYHQASVEEIAEQAGLSTGAVYSNFDGKADLCLALYERHCARQAQELEEVVARGATPEAQIEEASGHLLGVLRRDAQWLLLDMEFLAYAARHPELRARYAEVHAVMRDAVVHLIERATASFDLSLPAEPQALAVMMNALSMGFMFEKIADPDRVPDDALETALALVVRPRSQAPAP